MRFKGRIAQGVELVKDRFGLALPVGVSRITNADSKPGMLNIANVPGGLPAYSYIAMQLLVVSGIMPMKMSEPTVPTDWSSRYSAMSLLTLTLITIQSLGYAPFHFVQVLYRINKE